MAKTHPVALVTGGAKRVGRAIAHRLADAGFKLAITYRHSEKEARSLQKELGKQHLLMHVDFLDPPVAAEQIFQQVKRRFGRLDLLVNNASLYLPGSKLELSRMSMAVNYESPLVLCQKFAPLLKKSGGHIVNMLDLLAEKPWPEYLAYCASKAALASATLSLARELAPEVTVNGIAPGVVEWPGDYPREQREKYLKRVPLGRAGTPEDVANLVHFLGTAGSYITGQIIRLDGGRSIT
jgi:pteridine reductase